MTDRSRASWLVYALGALSVGAIAAAFLLIGAPSQSATPQSRIITAQRGVVQSTVSGSGNIQAATQLDLGFKTAGVVQRIYVTAGQHVTAGQLLAELNPQSAEVTLEQARASLQAGEAALAQEEESGGETSAATATGGSNTSGSGTGGAAKPAASSAALTPASTTTAPAGTAPRTTTTTSTTTVPTATKSAPSGSSPGATTTSEKPKESLATREANLASARATVKSEKLAAQSDEQAVADTKLLAPQSGTLVALAGEVGESVSGAGTSKAAAASSSSTDGASSSGGGATAARGAATATGSAGSSASGSSSSTSSSSFAVLSDLATMQLVVALSESEIVHVRVGAPATVTVEALEGVKLAAHVLSVATLSTSNGGVVSYDVTFQLDQLQSGLRPGMTASVEVIVKQAEGVNVPSTAISAGAVTAVRGAARVRQPVLTGLAGNSSTIVLSGLKAGERIVLPLAGASGAASVTSRLAGRAGGGGGLGGGGLGGGLGGGFGRSGG
jgi:multidrug efflux pump subunit AcrA (membrane-fusion protein)